MNHIQKGKIEVQGSPSELAQSGIDFIKLVGTEVLQGTEMKSERTVKKSISRQFSARTISLTSARSVGSFILDDIESDTESQVDDEIVAQLESSSKGKVNGSISINYFTAGAHWSVLGIILATFFVVQILASFTDYWVSFWYALLLGKRMMVEQLYFRFRTKQEEIRAFNSNQSLPPDMDFDTFSNTSTNMSILDRTQNQTFTLLPLELSTETCVYIHGALVASVFILGISR